MNWLITINIKQFLTDDNGNDAAIKATNEIADLIDDTIPYSWQIAFEYIEEIVDDLRDCNEMGWANNILEALYDWADEHHVWLGP